eukprot:Lankesteria_metandrocarpae@DN3635_c0_g1_i1.p2
MESPVVVAKPNLPEPTESPPTVDTTSHDRTRSRSESPAKKQDFNNYATRVENMATQLGEKAIPEYFWTDHLILGLLQVLTCLTSAATAVYEMLLSCRPFFYYFAFLTEAGCSKLCEYFRSPKAGSKVEADAQAKRVR